MLLVKPDILFRIRRSKILNRWHRSEIGLKFLTSFGPFPGFNKGTTWDLRHLIAVLYNMFIYYLCIKQTTLIQTFE